jgi:hypothetical protein
MRVRCEAVARRRRNVLTLLALVGLSLPVESAAQGVRGGADSVRVQLAGVEPAGADVRDGPQVEVRVAIVHAKAFHSWPDEPVVPAALRGLNPIATSIRIVSAPEGVELLGIDWPDPVPVTVRYSAEPLELLSFVDTTVARLRLRVPPRLEADARVELQVQFQSCDEEYCYPPRRETLAAPLVPDSRP